MESEFETNREFRRFLLKELWKVEGYEPQDLTYKEGDKVVHFRVLKLRVFG